MTTLPVGGVRVQGPGFHCTCNPERVLYRLPTPGTAALPPSLLGARVRVQDFTTLATTNIEHSVCEGYVSGFKASLHLQQLTLKTLPVGGTRSGFRVSPHLQPRESSLSTTYWHRRTTTLPVGGTRSGFHCTCKTSAFHYTCNTQQGSGFHGTCNPQEGSGLHHTCNTQHSTQPPHARVSATKSVSLEGVGFRVQGMGCREYSVLSRIRLPGGGEQIRGDSSNGARNSKKAETIARGKKRSQRKKKKQKAPPPVQEADSIERYKPVSRSPNPTQRTFESRTRNAQYLRRSR